MVICFLVRVFHCANLTLNHVCLLLLRRGPIWININYLALGALHHYDRQLLALSVTSDPVVSSLQKRCSELYHRLRHAVLRNVLREYQRTGFFWEQYEDTSGQGIRGHPFTGWTSAIVNIYFEIYW